MKSCRKGGVNYLTLIFVLMGCLIGIMVMTISLPSSVSASNGNITTFTPNQLAAGGPLPGNLSQIEEEQECIRSQQSETTFAPWYPTMSNTEHGGSERAGVFECAQFGGSFTEPNQVYAYQSPTSLGWVPSWIVTREPNELFVSGGGGSLAVPGPVISKMEAGSLMEQWRTPLSNNNVTGDWLISGATNFPVGGAIAVSQGQFLYKINTTTGAVEKATSLPTGLNPPGDSNFNGMNAFADGTLVLKTQNRVAGCTNQGYSFLFCANQSQASPSVAATEHI